MKKNERIYYQEDSKPLTLFWKEKLDWSWMQKDFDAFIEKISNKQKKICCIKWG